MNRVIKAFQKFDDTLQELIYETYKEGDLRKATFPFKGEIAEGVIFEDEENETVYLIPIDTIKSSKLSHADDDDDDDDTDDNEDSDIGDEGMDNDMGDEE